MQEDLKPIRRLKVIATSNHINCPYFRRQVPTSLCFSGHRTATHPVCFRCSQGVALEEQAKTRTYRRIIVGDDHPGNNTIYLRVKVNKTKHGVDYSYGKLTDGKIEMPFYETIVSGTYLSTREHHGPMTEAELDELAKQAQRTRHVMLRGVEPSVAPKKGRGKKVEKKPTEIEPLDLLAPPGKVKSRYFGWVSPGTVVKSKLKAGTITQSAFAGAKKKKEKDNAPISTESLIKAEAKRLTKEKRK